MQRQICTTLGQVRNFVAGPPKASVSPTVFTFWVDVAAQTKMLQQARSVPSLQYRLSLTLVCVKPKLGKRACAAFEPSEATTSLRREQSAGTWVCDLQMRSKTSSDQSQIRDSTNAFGGTLELSIEGNTPVLQLRQPTLPTARDPTSR